MASPNLQDILPDLTARDRNRMRRVCEVLRTSYTDFIEFAVKQAIDEMEGYAADVDSINRFYGRK